MIAIIEHKSTSEDIGPGSVYWRRLTLDPQVSLYLQAAVELGFVVDRVLYDVLRKPAPRPSAKGESPETYQQRCLDAIVADPDRYYQRGTIVRLETDAREAAVDVWQTAGAIREARRLNVWPKNPDACMPWGRMCEFLGVCCQEQSLDDPGLFAIGNAHPELASNDRCGSKPTRVRPRSMCGRQPARFARRDV